MNNNMNNNMKINKHKINILDKILFSRVMLIKVINIFNLNILIYKINNQINN